MPAFFNCDNGQNRSSFSTAWQLASQITEISNGSNTTLPTLLTPHVCRIALGYENINDHASPAKFSPVIPAPLAGKSILNRQEQSLEAGNPSHHQMVPNLKKLSNLFTDIFLDNNDTPPKDIA